METELLFAKQTFCYGSHHFLVMSYGNRELSYQNQQSKWLLIDQQVGRKAILNLERGIPWRKWTSAIFQEKKRALCPCFQTIQGHVPVLVLDHPIIRLYKELDYAKAEFLSGFCHVESPPWLFRNKIFQLDCSKLGNNEIELYSE